MPGFKRSSGAYREPPRKSSRREPRRRESLPRDPLRKELLRRDSLRRELLKRELSQELYSPSGAIYQGEPLYTAGFAGSETESPFRENFDGSDSDEESGLEDEPFGVSAGSINIITPTPEFTGGYDTDQDVLAPVEEPKWEPEDKLEDHEEAALETEFGSTIESVARCLNFVERAMDDGVNVSDIAELEEAIERWEKKGQTPMKMANANLTRVMKQVLKVSLAEACVMARETEDLKQDLARAGIYYD
ncbi:hypothetical protein F4810DRAFT_72399 [Camillea tinctor]|nr:hypothetical protein F4810DRAFT_72399 [Camillea tinctor]